MTPAQLVEKIRAGNEKAEAEFYHRYFNGVLVKLRMHTKDRSRAEDLAQDTMITVLERLRAQGIDEPEHLNRFVLQTARYIQIGWHRRLVNKTDYRESVDEMITADVGPEQLLTKERRTVIVREIIASMSVSRDREILYRYYVREQSKEHICEALDLGVIHFDRVLYRARTRFKQLVEGRDDIDE